MVWGLRKSIKMYWRTVNQNYDSVKNIWANCPRTGIPLLGTVSFFYLWVGSKILHKQIVWGCPENCLNSHDFWSKIKGVKMGVKRQNFTQQTDFALISRVVIRWHCNFTWSTNMDVKCFRILFTNLRKWSEKNTFYASKWIKK